MTSPSSGKGPEHRSVSQYNTYDKCPYSWHLRYQAVDTEGNRIKKVPAAWLPQGVAEHAADEAYEKDRSIGLEGAQAVFKDVYTEQVSRATADMEWSQWFASGPYKGREDTERRWTMGLEGVARYVDYKENKVPDRKIWTTDTGELAVELEFSIDLDGVKVVGFIDQVDYSRKTGVRAVDVKSGAKPPDWEDIQLPTYKVALEQENDVKVTAGEFFMTRKGKPTVPNDLKDWSKERVTEAYKSLDENIKAERFDPAPSEDNCRFCSVYKNCQYDFLQRTNLSSTAS